MSFFDDNDPIEEIMNRFFNQDTRYSQNNEVISSEQDERMIDFVETNKEFFLVFELPGYRKEDIKINISKNEIEVIAKRKVEESVPEYLSHKLSRGIQIKKPLLKKLSKKKYDWTFKNGVLEVRFKK